MLGDHLLPHVVTPIPSVLSTDAYGNEVRTLGDPLLPVLAFVQPLDPSEDTTDGQMRENRAKVYGNVDDLGMLDAFSHVRWDGRDYEVVGDAQRHDAPSGQHHIVLALRRVGA